jgi:hypothetical protein
MNRLSRWLAWPLIVVTATAGLIGGTVWLSVDPAAAGTAPTMTSASRTTAGVDGYLYGYAPVVTARTRANQLCGIGIGVNTLVSSPFLGTPAGRGVVAPNVDTLYSLAWLDLRGGPVVLTVAAITDRYYGFEFMDMYTNVFANIGARTTGNAAGRYAIVPPGWTGTLPADIHVQTAPTWDVWMLGRTLVKGPDDLTAARVVQTGYKLTVADIATAQGIRTTTVPVPPALPTDCAHLRSPQTPYDGGAAYFDELATVLAADPPRAADRPALARLAKLGVRPGGTPSQGSPHTVARLQTAVTDGQAYLVRYARSAFPAAGRTWSSSLNIARFGTNYLLRASTAMVALAANVPAESTYYFSGQDVDGQSLTGSKTYRLRFPAGALPPTGPVGFWSLTMYDESYFLVPNTLNRYALGDRSSLAVNPDGSLDLYLSATAPAGVESNWLPAPDGPFHVYLRIYNPSQPVLDGTWLPPNITPVSSTR